VFRPCPIPTSSDRPGFRPLVIATRNEFGAVLNRGFGDVRIRFHRSTSARSPIASREAIVAATSFSDFPWRRSFRAVALRHHGVSSLLHVYGLLVDPGAERFIDLYFFRRRRRSKGRLLRPGTEACTQHSEQDHRQRADESASGEIKDVRWADPLSRPHTVRRLGADAPTPALRFIGADLEVVLAIVIPILASPSRPNPTETDRRHSNGGLEPWLCRRRAAAPGAPAA
jgi:hypothetical protein